MAQQQLDVCGFQFLLQEDDIKKEVPDIIKLSCFYCGTAEDVDIKDSNKNTCPFICLGCYTIENCEKASEDTTTKVEVITLINWIHQCTFVQNPLWNYQCWLVQSNNNMNIMKQILKFFVCINSQFVAFLMTIFMNKVSPFTTILNILGL